MPAWLVDVPPGAGLKKKHTARRIGRDALQIPHNAIIFTVRRGVLARWHMSQKPQIEQRELTALVKYAAINFIQSQRQEGYPLAAALRAAALRPWPDREGRIYARRTLEDWWYTHATGGFGALQPARRSDRGSYRLLAPELGEWIIQRLKQTPAVPLKVLYPLWLREEHKKLPSITTIYRFLRREGYDAAALRRGRLEAGPNKAFEAPYSNDLWMVDFSPGPVLVEDGRVVHTQLALLIDDHSRLVPYAAYYANANTAAFHDALKQGIERRGVPGKLYTDQGKPFVNSHSKIVCANLGIRLLHAKPYAAWSKGKVERMFLSIQRGFEIILRTPGMQVHSLSELNEKFWHWLEQLYHARVHSSTGMKPCERFTRGLQGAPERRIEPQIDLAALFYTRTTRTVRKDGTVRLEGKLYEVDLSLRGLRIELRYDPVRLDRIEVYYQEKGRGLAHRVNLHLNSQRESSRYYDR